MITLKNIDKKYDSVMVMDDLSIDINKGAFVSVVGESGVGKSTLLRIIAGLEQINGGTVQIEEKKIEPKDMSIIFQDFNQLLPWKTVISNVEFPLKLAGVSKQRRRFLAEEILKKVGLEEKKKQYPHTLSGGMKQRVAIARALINSPKILLMDEPFGSVDIYTKEKLQDLLLSLWREQKQTVIFVTHDLEEAVKMSTDIAIIKDKRVSMVKNTLKYPRKKEEQDFRNLVTEVKNLIETV